MTSTTTQVLQSRVISEIRNKISVEHAVELIYKARGKTCVITGAGVSTESGIPDYRGPMGRYMQTTKKPLTHSEFVSSEQNRQRFWARAIVGFSAFTEKLPNRSHHSLVELERHNHIQGIITQNVDRLHHRAGSSNIIELHGRGDRVECLHCKYEQDRSYYQSKLEEENVSWLSSLDKTQFTLTADGDAILTADTSKFIVLPCMKCGVGVMKPSYVFFGGSIPSIVKDNAEKLVRESTVLFLIGSTSSTFSCFRLVKLAKELNSNVVIVNKGATRVDEFADGFFDQDSCGSFLENVSNELGSLINS